MFRRQGRYSEAEALTLEAIRASGRAFGEDGGQTIRAKYNMAVLYMYQRRYPEAEALYLEVLGAIWGAVPGGKERETLMMNQYDPKMNTMNDNVIYFAEEIELEE